MQTLWLHMEDKKSATHVYLPKLPQSYTNKKLGGKTIMESKLFKVVQSDGNDRDTYAHVKAYDIQDVIDWLHETYFRSEALI